MKRLLAFLILLGLGAPAYCVVVPVLEIDGSTTWPQPFELASNQQISITVTSRQDGAYGGWLVLTDAHRAEFAGSMRILPDAGADASTQFYSQPGISRWWFQAVSFEPVTPVVAGRHFAIDLLLTDYTAGEPPVRVDLYAGDGKTILDSVPFIPEPASIVMLALGSLTILRRHD